jgi:hypothetical protein
MKTQWMLGAALLALAGCGGGHKDGGNATADGTSPTASASAAATGSGGGSVQIQPGEWETKIESVEVDAPGLPPQAKDMLARAMGGSKTTVRNCVTPEQARRPDADMFSGKGRGNCKSSDFSISGGHMHGTVSCPAGEGRLGSMTMVMDGQFSPQGYSVSQNMTTDAGGTKMTIKSRVTGKRVGECSDATKEG